MTTLEIILLIALAVTVAVTIVLLILQQGKSVHLVRDYEAARDRLQDEISTLRAEKASAESRLQAQSEYAAQLRVQHEEALRQEAARRAEDLTRMQQAFESISARNSEVFRNRSAETIAELMKPVQEKFQAFSEAVKESQEKSIARHSALEQQIKDLDEHSRSIGDEARNLANALTGYSKVQGDFGEMLLVDVLRNAGLTEGIHFRTQGVMADAAGHEIKSEGGRTLIPDVMVFYPDETTVIIDSKVSLKAYNDYMAATAVEDRIRFAKAHLESVRSHVDELKNKDYASYIPDGRRKVNYNIMFIPVEGAFRLMLEEDPVLWQLAKDNNVLIVSQMTLVIVLNMIQMAWKQYSQEENIAEVFKTAEELMSQLKGWMDSFVDVGEQLGKAAKSYEQAAGKLRDSNQSVLKKIGKLEKLGLAPKRSKAKIRTGARLSGPESIIPPELNPEENE